MQWNKVSPDNMPRDKELVFVSATLSDESRVVWAEIRWNEEHNLWEVLADAIGDYWEEASGVITHWMYYPDPAED